MYNIPKKLITMKQDTFDIIKKEIGAFYKVYKALSDNFNNYKAHGNDAVYPYMIAISVIIHNMAVSETETELKSYLNLLEIINNYHNKCYTSHYPYTEISMIIHGNKMNEDYK